MNAGTGNCWAWATVKGVSTAADVLRMRAGAEIVMIDAGALMRKDLTSVVAKPMNDLAELAVSLKHWNQREESDTRLHTRHAMSTHARSNQLMHTCTHTRACAHTKWRVPVWGTTRGDAHCCTYGHGDL